MTIVITDPKTNTSYKFDGLVPLRRVSGSCQYGTHDSCILSPDAMIKSFDIEFTKRQCCLCDCHGVSA